jgi:purine-binding chemotaxis protein CheW
MSTETNDRFLGFTLGEEEFGLPLLTVKEVIAIPEITPIPQAPKHFIGIMNLRGQVISVIDLRTKLGITAKKNCENAVIICDIGGVQLGAVVDSVNQVYTPNPEEITPSSELEHSKIAAYIHSVYRDKNRLVLFLDIGKTLDVADQAMLRKAA